MRRVILGLSSIFVAACGPARSFDDVPLHLFESTPSYATEIAPLMKTYCTTCHTSDGLRAGGVELDRYESLYAARLKNVCVSIESDLVDRYADELLPPPRDPPVTRVPCHDWEPYSMPAGAQPGLTPSEQVIFVRWLVTGGAP